MDMLVFAGWFLRAGMNPAPTESPVWGELGNPSFRKSRGGVYPRPQKPAYPLKNLQKRKGIRLSRSAYEEGSAFSITITTAKRYPWFKIHGELADTSISLILALAQEREAVVFAWCIMPDHIHLL
jgi:hypothetical protein